ncbi:MAG TPA: lipase family protein [Fibrobacteria bacterium]|nr:lipase family protein [Fibrobacteria bacterium]
MRPAALSFLLCSGLGAAGAGDRAAFARPEQGRCNADYALLSKASYRCALVYDLNEDIVEIPGGRNVYIDSIQYLTDFPASESRKVFVEFDSVENTQWVVFRGTSALRDWLVDGDEGMIEDPVLKIKVHRGFQAAADSLYRKIKPRLRPRCPIYVTGHSLGGAMAVLAAAYIRRDPATRDWLRGCITFGQPKVTNGPGTKVLEKEIKLIRVIDRYDPVARVPPADGYQLLASGQDLYDPDAKRYGRGPPGCDGIFTCAGKWIYALFSGDSTTHYFHFGEGIHIDPAMLSDPGVQPWCRQGESEDDWKEINLLWSAGDHSMVLYDSIICGLAHAKVRHLPRRSALIGRISAPPPALLAVARDGYALSGERAPKGRYRVRLQTLSEDSAGRRSDLAPIQALSAGEPEGRAISLPAGKLAGENGYARLAWERLDRTKTPMAREGAYLVQPRPGNTLQFRAGFNVFARGWWPLKPELRPDFDLYAGSRWSARSMGALDVRFMALAAENDIHAAIYGPADASNPFLRSSILRADLFTDFLWIRGRFLPGGTAGFGIKSTPGGGRGMVELEPRVFLGAATPRMFFPEEWLYYRAAFAYDKLWDRAGSDPWRYDLSAQFDLPVKWMIFPGAKIEADLPWDFDISEGNTDLRFTFTVGLNLNAIAQMFHSR